MASLIDTFRNFFTPTHHLPAGMYHYIAPLDDPRNYRLNLRLEQDGNGILIVNGATILHLNETAAEYAYYLVQNQSGEFVARKMAARYHVNPKQALQDYQSFAERIQTLINTPDLDPVTFLDFERQAPLSGNISAPYRLDCALTYRLPASEAADSAPQERVKRELTTEEWEKVLDKTWQVGIPQIVFTGGEPTLREDLPQLIDHASQNGQVTGLLSDGLRLVDVDYLNRLLQTGLDHLMIVFNPDAPEAWQALQNVLAADLFVVLHLTLTAGNQAGMPGLLEKIASLGVKAMSLTIDDPALKSALQEARAWLANHQIELVWNLPVPYSNLHPIALETVQEAEIDGAGRAWLYVEPDGDVLPSQGINRVMGNLLSDDWAKIWHPGVKN